MAETMISGRPYRHMMMLHFNIKMVHNRADNARKIVKSLILQSTCSPRASCDSALLILSHAFCTLSASQRAGFVKHISFKKPCHSGGSPDRGQKFKRKVAFTELHSSIATSIQLTQMMIGSWSPGNDMSKNPGRQVGGP